LSDAIEKKASSRVVQIMAQLQHSNQPAPLVIWALTQSAHKAPAFIRASAFSQLLEADLLIKSGEASLAWQSMLNICLLLLKNSGYAKDNLTSGVR